MWITVRRPRCMKNGGFSTTSWPTLTMTSAASIARCTKSPSDRAALPSHKGWSSSTTPLPIWVVKNGMPSLSINARQSHGGALAAGGGTDHQDGMLGAADGFGGLYQRRVVRRGTAGVFGGKQDCVVDIIASDVLRQLQVYGARAFFFCTPERLANACGDGRRRHDLTGVFLVRGCIMSTTSTS